MDINTQYLDEGPLDDGSERWASIDEMYAVSDHGRVWAAYVPQNQTWDGMELMVLNGRPGILKKFFLDRYGYQQVMLRERKMLVHRLVALSFIANPMSYPMVLHQDGNPTHNWFRNLRWGNARMNTRDAQTHGTYRNGTGRIPKQDLYSVDLLYEMVDRGLPNKKIARMFGIAPSTVRYRVKNRPQ